MLGFQFMKFGGWFQQSGGQAWEKPGQVRQSPEPSSQDTQPSASQQPLVRFKLCCIIACHEVTHFFEQDCSYSSSVSMFSLLTNCQAWNAFLFGTNLFFSWVRKVEGEELIGRMKPNFHPRLYVIS